jgi:inosine-uridine nucleoside N-ribohydrolase
MALPFVVPLFRDLFVIMDPGRDQDDEVTLVKLNRLIRLGILNVLGVVANLAPSSQRARLAKGTLDLLGQPDIPVGAGTGCLQPDDDGLSYQFNVGYLAETPQIQDGKELILRTLRDAKPGGIVLLLISGLTDAAAVLREHPYLFAKAVRRVVIMGGVIVKDNAPVLDEQGRLQPDDSQNHKFDMESAKYLYQQLQDAGIRITVVSRHAATAAKVSRSIYDDMANTGHPIGIRLRDAQREAIEQLWRRACLPASDKSRQLPERCDKTWFCNAFCGGEGLDRKGDDSIWDIVKTFNLYDPCTLIAAIPQLREHFYAPCVTEVDSADGRPVEHLVIGVSATQHNVRYPGRLAQFLRAHMLKSLQASMKARRAA